jgi:FixJ family two-component response regulator
VLEPGVMFLQKPFSRTVLLDKVEEVLSRDMTGRD